MYIPPTSFPCSVISPPFSHHHPSATHIVYVYPLRFYSCPPFPCFFPLLLSPILHKNAHHTAPPPSWIHISRAYSYVFAARSLRYEQPISRASGGLHWPPAASHRIRVTLSPFPPSSRTDGHAVYSGYGPPICNSVEFLRSTPYRRKACFLEYVVRNTKLGLGFRRVLCRFYAPKYYIRINAGIKLYTLLYIMKSQAQSRTSIRYPRSTSE